LYVLARAGVSHSQCSRIHTQHGKGGQGTKSSKSTRKIITHRLARAAHISKQLIDLRISPLFFLREETPEGDYRDTVINTTPERQGDK
jgi:hypothetical protein